MNTFPNEGEWKYIDLRVVASCDIEDLDKSTSNWSSVEVVQFYFIDSMEFSAEGACKSRYGAEGILEE